MSVVELDSIMPAPPQPPFDTARWTEVERSLGTHLPQDYKDFIDHYGTGKIANFISIFSPFSRNANLSLIEQQRRQADVLRELSSSGEVLPYSAFPVENGILPVGMTDNGDVIYWQTGVGEWHIVVNEARGPDWESFGCTLTEFLAGLLSGRVTCGIFPRLTTPPARFVALQ